MTDKKPKSEAQKIAQKQYQKKYMSSQNIPPNKRQGGKEVHEVIELFIKYLESKEN